MNVNTQQHRALLQSIARRAMLATPARPDFSTEAMAEWASFNRRSQPEPMNPCAT